MAKSRCFVVMGFGIKTDLATGRKLDLDKSYLALIKPVVENKGLECIRADEIPSSGNIDIPMYNELYNADIVIADLSTANSNAFYELGVRYALKPRSTIVMSEDKLSFPFDVNHIKINKYTHLGDSIDYFEVLRFQKVLGEAIDYVLQHNHPDSPVYTFLDGLIPPALREQAEEMAQQINKAISDKTEENLAEQKNESGSQTLSLLVKQAEEALTKSDFALAKSLFNAAILMSNSEGNQAITSNNAYLFQRLALSTYKSAQPDKKTALLEAVAILEKLDLLHTNDTETVALAGAIEKKLYQIGEGVEHLIKGISHFQRAYYLLNNRYNGINLAYLLDRRADSELDKSRIEKIADLVWARRIRKEVLLTCDSDLLKILNRQKSNAIPAGNMDLSNEMVLNQQSTEANQQFWIMINKAEASFGIGDMESYKQAMDKATEMKDEAAANDATREHITDLQNIYLKLGSLMESA